MLTAEALKQFVSYVQCAAYPDVAAHEESRRKVNEAWPAYADDLSLSRSPQSLWIPRSFRQRSACNVIAPDCNMRSRG